EHPPDRGRGRAREPPRRPGGGGDRGAGRPAREPRRRRRRRRRDAGGARRALPRVASRPVQAAARVPSRRVAPEERLGQDPAPRAERRVEGDGVTEYDGFRVERDGGVATVTLDVPGKFNRVSMNARDELAAAFAELDRDEAVRFVVLTGADGQFTAGGDI